MPSKYYTLSSVAKQFNITVNEVVTLLQSKGYIIENMKTTKINQKQYDDISKKYSPNTQIIELKLVEKFDDNTNQWFLGKDSDIIADIFENKYLMHSLKGWNFSTIKVEESDFINSENYSINTSIKLEKAESKALFGLAWAGDNENANVFLINSKGQFLIGIFGTTNFTEEKSGQVNFIFDRANIDIKVEKNNKHEVCYLVNNQQVHIGTSALKIHGSEVGFILSEGVKVVSSLFCIINNVKKLQKGSQVQATISKKGESIKKVIPDKPKDDYYKAIKTDSTLIEVKHNSKNVTYKRLFERHLKDVKKIEIHDPYLRFPHQIQNLIDFCHLIYDTNKELVELHLVTTEILKQDKQKQTTNTLEDEKKAKENERTKTMFYNLKKSLDNEGKITFTYDFKPDSAFHARKIIIDNTKLMLLDRGLDIYQRYDLSSIESKRQESRKSKGFYMVVLENINQK